MSNIKVTLGGQELEFQANSSIKDILNTQSLPNSSKLNVIAAKFNGNLLDLSAPLNEDGTLEFITEESPEALELLRHSTAHIMAEAVIALFPEAKPTIGPAIENGFYYDFDYPQAFTPDDLIRIEKKMKEIVAKKAPFERTEMAALAAKDFFQKKNEPYKVELIQDLIDNQGTNCVSLYQSGDFIDLCRGPHLENSSKSRYFKLLSVAGAYWRGDEHRPMLQRIYGTVFFTKQALNDYLTLLEEAKKRDHRKLGKELELFSISEDVGGGLIIWHPKGALLRATLEEFERHEHLNRGYDLVNGPQILKSDMWKKSGHLDYYSENMYFTEIDEQSYAIKPMNCLSHILIYKSHLRSFRDLPLRFFELGTVQRHEKSGVLHGLTRVRQFTQDDAHLFCAPEQVDIEIKNILDLITDMMSVFGFEYEIELSTRPEKSIGSDQEWDLATNALKKALADKQAVYEINEGDGAFYGPKIDIKLKDALGRRWQCATIQCDFTLPERFDLSYIDHDGQKKRPVMLHRTVFGSIERFIGILIEHYAGAFPMWLAPVQLKILTVTSRADEFANELTKKFRKIGLRAQADIRNEKLGYKIREAQMMKIPYTLILGDKEVENRTVSIRKLGGVDLGTFSIDDCIAFLGKEADVPSWE